MAQKALSILSDDEVLLKFKSNALDVAQEFNIDKIVPLYEQLYRKALKKLV